ncbi:MAG: aspartate 1-decarboxylase [Candidatus Weimeria sp.]
MLINILKSKIHRAVVTQAELSYVGSITIDEELMKAAHIREYEKVEIADVENGERFSTYVIAGEAGSGIICLNGAAARKSAVGDHVIIMCYAQADPDREQIEKPVVVLVDEKNRATRVVRYEKHGRLV